MTKTQIWVAAFLTAFILLFLLARVTKHENSHETTSNPMPQAGMSSKELNGAELLSKNGCTNCHGAGLEGTQMAPPLVNISSNWTREKLINYLRNPSSYMDSDRFKDFRKQYPGTIMPPYNNLEVKDLGKIADYLLTR